MEESIRKTLTGVVSKGNLSTPKTVTSKNTGDTWQSYSCLFKGVFEDTQEKFEGFINSSYPVAIYDASTEEIYEDIPSLDQATFEADVMVTQKGEKMYLYAINVKKMLEESTPSPFERNPFAVSVPEAPKTAVSKNDTSQTNEVNEEQSADYAYTDIPF